MPPQEVLPSPLWLRVPLVPLTLPRLGGAGAAAAPVQRYHAALSRLRTLQVHVRGVWATLDRSTFSCDDSRGTLSMHRASRCSRLGNFSSHSGGTSRSKRRWRGSWRGGLRSRSGCCRGWSRRWYRRSFPSPLAFLPFPFPVLPSSFAALAVPALPCPSLPLPPLRLFHVIQDVPVPPLPGGTARLDPRPPSARLMSPGFFLLPGVTGFVAGRAATARSTLGLPCWPLVLWGPPPESGGGLGGGHRPGRDPEGTWWPPSFS